MPEVSETIAPPLHKFIRNVSDPFSGQGECLPQFERGQIVQAAQRGRDSALARYPHLKQEISRMYDLFYNVLWINQDEYDLLGEIDTKIRLACDAAIVHGLVDHINYAQSGFADESYVKTMLRVIDTTQRVIFGGGHLRNVDQRKFWASARAELGVIRAIVEDEEMSSLGSRVRLLDYLGVPNKGNFKANEVFQADINAKTDFFVILEKDGKKAAFLVDVKAKGDNPYDPVKVEVRRHDDTNPVVRSILRSYGTQVSYRALIVVPSASFYIYNLLDTTPKRPVERIREFANLKPEARSVIVEGLKNAS